MARIEMDEQTAGSVRLAPRLWRVSEVEVVRRLVAGLSLAADAGRTPPEQGDRRIDTWLVHGDQRTDAVFDTGTRQIEITTGPLAGQRFLTPS